MTNKLIEDLGREIIILVYNERFILKPRFNNRPPKDVNNCSY